MVRVMSDILIGDRVVTSKGCRMAGSGGVLTVIETGKRWGSYDACMCRKQDGNKRLYLTKNLTPYTEGARR